MNNIDRRFALLAADGDILYPYMKKQLATGRFGFAFSPLGEGDRNGQGQYTTSIKEVIRRLVFDGWKARVTTIDKAGKQRHGSLGIGKRVVPEYWVAPEFEYLVKGAPTKPVKALPR